MNAALRGIFFAGAAVALSGCMVPQIASGVREYLADPQQTRIVEQTVVMRLRKAGPELRIGPVECAQTPFARSAGICTVPVDGRPISVALRYDEDRHREVAEMRAAVVRTSVTVRSIETGAWIAYRVRGRAACGSAPVRVEPVGASMKCTLVTSDGRRHDVRLRIDARLTPHAVIVLPAGFARVAAVERPLRRLERAFHADPARLPGALVAAYIKASDVPYLRAMEPKLAFGGVQCPRYLDGSISTLQAAVAYGCWIGSKIGYFQIAAFTGDTGHLDFQGLSIAYDLRKFTASVERMQARFARTHPHAALASIDCGPQAQIVLTLLSVHYCDVRLADGVRRRLGIEYYDPFEGAHVVVEREPGRGQS